MCTCKHSIQISIFRVHCSGYCAIKTLLKEKTSYRQEKLRQVPQIGPWALKKTGKVIVNTGVASHSSSFSITTSHQVLALKLGCTQQGSPALLQWLSLSLSPSHTFTHTGPCWKLHANIYNGIQSLRTCKWKTINMATSRAQNFSNKTQWKQRVANTWAVLF